MEQQGPSPHPKGPRRPRRKSQLGQEGLHPRLLVAIPRRRRGLHARSCGGPAEREREGARGGVPGPGAGRMHCGGAACYRQLVRVPGRIRPPRVPESGPHIAPPLVFRIRDDDSTQLATAHGSR